MISAFIRRIKLDHPKIEVERILRSIRENLSLRERELLELRLPWTQQEVADKWGLTKQRIMAIEARAIDKINKNL